MKMWQIRTENWMGAPGATDPNTWQAFVFAPQDEWSVIKIPLARYLPTWKGKIVESDAEMNAARVTGMGLSLTAEGGPEGGEQGPGPFHLELDWIKALRVT
jgi:NADH dehydrogenase [ubiquinone] 1 alpha subcomplex assembly factor 1